MADQGLTVRYRCTGVAHELQKASNGSETRRAVYTVTLIPEPTDDSFIHGTPLQLGLSAPAALEVGAVYALTITPVIG